MELVNECLYCVSATVILRNEWQWMPHHHHQREYELRGKTGTWSHTLVPYQVLTGPICYSGSERGFLRFPGHGWTSHIYVCQTEGWQSNLLVCVFIRSLGPSKAPSLTWFLWTLTLALMGSLAQKVGLRGVKTSVGPLRVKVTIWGGITCYVTLSLHTNDSAEPEECGLSIGVFYISFCLWKQN